MAMNKQETFIKFFLTVEAVRKHAIIYGDFGAISRYLRQA